MKIAFLWYFDKAPLVHPNWRDGLRKAVEIISEDHEVDWLIGQEVTPKPGVYDAIIFWDDSNSKFFNEIDKYKTEVIGLCLTTDPYNFDNLRKLDVIYVESDPVYEQVRSQGLRAIKAFGTDVNFFEPPHPRFMKDIPYFYPATFSPWKRQSEIAYLGKELTCIGTMQPDGQYEYDACKKMNVNLEVGYYPAEKIKHYYQRAKKVIIPAVHGSERTVLEAMACGIQPLVINTNNVKAMSYIHELNASGLDPRTFVFKNYSAQKYAKDLLRGIQ